VSEPASSSSALHASSPNVPARGVLSAVLLFLLLIPIRLYRAVVSPFIPPVCRFHPSCSAYALEALQTHGPFRGSFLAAWRLMRCHPFNPGGLDPVPPLHRS